MKDDTYITITVRMSRNGYGYYEGNEQINVTVPSSIAPSTHLGLAVEELIAVQFASLKPTEKNEK